MSARTHTLATDGLSTCGRTVPAERITAEPTCRQCRRAATATAVEAAEFGAFVRRILRAYRRRVADRDIEGLAGLVGLRTELDDAIGQAVADLNAQGYSWAEIGRVTGTTRQGAQQAHQRWTRRAA